MSTVTAVSFKPKATRKRLKKEILSDDFKKRKIFWKNIAENCPSHITTHTPPACLQRLVFTNWLLTQRGFISYTGLNAKMTMNDNL
jgi:hypothetical protein